MKLVKESYCSGARYYKKPVFHSSAKSIQNSVKLVVPDKFMMDGEYKFHILGSYNDVIDGDVYQLDKESDETHYTESYECGHGNLLEFFSVWFCASFD